jgi:hypothetical protein
VPKSVISILLCINSRSRSYFTTDGQSVSMPWCWANSGACDQILLPVRTLLSESCSLLSVGRPLWRDDGSAVYSAITQWSESHRTRNHTLLSHLRLFQPGGPCSPIYISQEQGGPVIPPGIGFPFRRLLWLTGLQWRYSNPPPHGILLCILCINSLLRNGYHCLSSSNTTPHTNLWIIKGYLLFWTLIYPLRT